VIGERAAEILWTEHDLETPSTSFREAQPEISSCVGANHEYGMPNPRSGGVYVVQHCPVGICQCGHRFYGWSLSAGWGPGEFGVAVGGGGYRPRWTIPLGAPPPHRAARSRRHHRRALEPAGRCGEF